MKYVSMIQIVIKGIENTSTRMLVGVGHWK